jgi:rare lipoprotein A
MKGKFWQNAVLLLPLLIISGNFPIALAQTVTIDQPAPSSTTVTTTSGSTSTGTTPSTTTTSITAPSDTTGTTTPTTTTEPLPTEIFPDVKVGSPYFIGIKYLKDHGLVNGYPDGTFKPGQNVNRAEALKILGSAITVQKFSSQEKPINSLEATPETKLQTCPFPDLNQTAWYYSFVCSAFHNYVVSGYPDGNFKPEQTINKVEALKMAVLQSGLSTDVPWTDNFDDISPTDWFWDYARLANYKSFIVEDRRGNLNPAQTLNRGDFAMLIYRLLRTVENNSEFGRATFYAGRFDGQSTANGESFASTDLTAAHKTLPFGTIVKVTNLANGKTVNVRINDRGPYVNGAIIDLSTEAFTQIATKSTGVIDSEVEIVSTP